MNARGSRLAKMGRPRLCVVGDAMLDRYTWGDAERISPEAPVLVLRVDEGEVRLGGAASVARLLRGLEADVTLASVIGNDASGRTVRKLLDEAGIDDEAVIVDSARPTTTKERFLGRAANRHAHQILRVDTESRVPLDREQILRLADDVVQRLAQLVPDRPSAVLISDYGKGVCTPELVSAVITAGRAAGVPVLVDPARGADYTIYRGATLIKPNRIEAELVLGRSLSSPAEACHGATELRKRHEFEAVVITLDSEGLVVATSAWTEHFPVMARAVYDITGAGDMVLAMLGLCLGAGLTLVESIDLANVAAGLEVQQPGVMPISRAEVQRELDRRSVSPPRTCESTLVELSFSKLVTQDEIGHVADEHRRAGRTIVFTNGCFDLLHVGHVTLLEEASRMGDVLIVAINSDDSVRKLKGAARPIIAEHDRARMLGALGCVDHVLIFDDDTPHRLLEAIRPDLLVKGGTTDHIVGREIVEAYGGRTVWTSHVPGLSTTLLLQRLHTINEIASAH